MFSHNDWKFTASWVFSSGRVYTGVENIIYDNWEKAADTFGAADARDIYYYVLQGNKNIHRFPPIHWLEIAVSKKINIGKINGEIDLSLFNVYKGRKEPRAGPGEPHLLFFYRCWIPWIRFK